MISKFSRSALIKMQQIFLILITICCSVDFATCLMNGSLAKSNKRTSVMMRTFVKISAELLPENSTSINDNVKGMSIVEKADTNELIQKIMVESPIKKLEIQATEFTLEVPTTPSPITLTPTKREIHLNARQNLIMNQILAVYALSGIQDPVCKNHTLEYKKALRNFEPWALKMFDSSSKLQSGIFLGDLMDYGSFRECVEIYANTNSGPIRGQHCTIKITPNDDLLRYVMSYRNISRRRFKKAHRLMQGAGLTWSVCLPDSCPSDEILRHFNKTILVVTEGLTLNVTMDKYSCYKMLEDEKPLTHAAWTVIFLFGALFIITFICTTVDVIKQNSNDCKSELVTIFSAYSNVKKLLAVRTEKQPLDCLNGIRVLSMCYVVVGHRYVLSMFFPLINAMEIMDWVLYYTSTIIIGGTVSVDTFFLITGLLVTYSFFDQMSKGIKFNLPMFVLHRWLRVTPGLMVVALIHATLVQYVGSGPLWKKTLRSIQKPCQYFWWATMLHIQSYVNAPFICILPTWYLTCDTQYYFLSPLILYPLWKWPIFGYLLLIVTYVASLAISFYLAWVNKYNALGLLSNNFLRSDYFIYHYVAPHTRASPFIIGMGFGYILFKTRNEKIRMSLLTVLAGWMCCFSLLLVAVLGNHGFQLEEKNYNRMESSIFLSCTRSGWTLGVVWLIWACRHGYGGPIDYILSFPTYQILTRLSYAVFLIHMGNQFLINGSTKSPGYFSDFNMIFMFFGDIVSTLGLAFFFTLFIESPVIKAQGLLMKKFAKKKDQVEPILRYVQEKGNEKMKSSA